MWRRRLWRPRAALKESFAEKVFSLGHLGSTFLYKEYYNMSDEQIEKTKEDIGRQMEKQQDAANAEGAGPNMASEAGGQESAENKAPPSENTMIGVNFTQ